MSPHVNRGGCATLRERRRTQTDDRLFVLTSVAMNDAAEPKAGIRADLLDDGLLAFDRERFELHLHAKSVGRATARAADVWRQCWSVTERGRDVIAGRSGL